ncbi:MAG: hypothetical protein KJ905_03265 [Nanoarchaeota archaeon]|nr:hypothetical protein [Nanoarchaeota archaeon]MBU1501767.1 hypothetical protein [Nanoarchaeota archaeon]MBU2458863.1 hypothetical protein [Nanoarchaeota archaeon]
MRLSRKFEGSSIQDLERNLTNEGMAGSSWSGKVSEYRRLREIENYLKGLTGEQFLEILAYENFPPTSKQIKESVPYKSLEAGCLQVLKSSRQRTETPPFVQEAFERFESGKQIDL